MERSIEKMVKCECSDRWVTLEHCRDCDHYLSETDNKVECNCVKVS